jgi:hypothetical protein
MGVQQGAPVHARELEGRVRAGPGKPLGEGV